MAQVQSEGKASLTTARTNTKKPARPTSNRASRPLKLEKPELEIRFIPIVCAAPLLYAQSHGLFEKHGLQVHLKPVPGWSGIKESLVYEQADAVHMLSPMPLACNLGIDGKKADVRLAAIQNINGQAITLASKYLGIQAVQEMKGFTFGVPYRFSMQYYLLSNFLAEQGIDPLHDVKIIEVSPPRMPYYLEKGWVDGILSPEPYNQIIAHRGSGFIYSLSRDMWPGHPCCSLATSREFIESCPNTFQAMIQSLVEAEWVLHQADAAERKDIAQEISGPDYLNQEDVLAVEQVLTGHFHDGQGKEHIVHDRIDFVPHPWPEHGTWILSQMQRWGQLHGHVDYNSVVHNVFQTEGTRALAQEIGYPASMTGSLEGIPSFTTDDPYGYMAHQPFSSFTEQPKPERSYHLSSPLRARITDINERLAALTAGQYDMRLEVTSADEIGYLEQLINEIALNSRFAQLALVEQNERLQRTLALQQATFDAAADGVLAVDSKGKIISSNDMFAKMWQIPEAVMATREDEQLLGFVINQLKDPEAFINKVNELYSKPAETSHDFVDLADGQVFERDSEPQRIGDQIVGRVWNFRDITETRKAQKERERLIRELREALRFKDEFFAMMSHELRTPLNAMIGLLGIMLMGDNLDERNKMFATRARANSERLLTLINNILDISRMEAGRLELVPRPISLHHIVAKLQTDMGILAEQKGLSFTIRLHPSLPGTITIDEDAITKILVNLVANAIKFTEKGSVELAMGPQDGKLLIQVKDTGIGIPAHMKDVIFDSFRQVDSSSTRAYGGSGLGLSIVVRLCVAMQGTVTVDSQPGEGSTFVVSLPLHD